MANPLLPLLVLLVVLGLLGAVGYVVYNIASDVAEKTGAKMEKHNISLSKEGMRVKLKDVREEDYVGSTQNILVNAWNFSSWPGYKSRLWNKQAEQPNGRGSVSGASSSSGYQKR